LRCAIYTLSASFAAAVALQYCRDWLVKRSETGMPLTEEQATGGVKATTSSRSYITQTSQASVRERHRAHRWLEQRHEAAIRRR
jgi:hypothetical protein